MIQKGDEFFCILDQLGLNFEAINLKVLQIVGNIVVHNLLKFFLLVVTPRYIGHRGVTTPWYLGLFWIFSGSSIVTPQYLGHRGVSTPQHLGHREVSTLWYIGHRGVMGSCFKIQITISQRPS